MIAARGSGVPIIEGSTPNPEFRRGNSVFATSPTALVVSASKLPLHAAGHRNELRQVHNALRARLRQQAEAHRLVDFRHRRPADLGDRCWVSFFPARIPRSFSTSATLVPHRQRSAFCCVSGLCTS